MPAFGVYATGATGRMAAATGYARSLSSGSIGEYAEVLRIEGATDTTPGRAFISFRTRPHRLPCWKTAAFRPNS